MASNSNSKPKEEPVLDQVIEDVAREISAKRSFRERIRERGRTLRLLGEILWAKYLGNHRQGGTR